MIPKWGLFWGRYFIKAFFIARRMKKSDSCFFNFYSLQLSVIYYSPEESLQWIYLNNICAKCGVQ